MTLSTNQFGQLAVKGQTDLKMTPNTFSCAVHSSQATALKPGQAVKIYDDAGGVPKVVAVAADTDKIFGFVPFTFKDVSFPALSSLEIVMDFGVIFLEASAAIARGAQLEYVVAGEKVATLAGGKTCAGMALDKAAADGDLIRVLVQVDSGAEVAATVAAVATVDATDLATAEALANQLKITVNAILTNLKAAGHML